MRTFTTLLLALFILGRMLFLTREVQAQASERLHEIKPGDTWVALGMRFGLEPAVLRQQAGHMNQSREPVIGTTLGLSPAAAERPGRLLRVNDGGLLQTAVLGNQSPWGLAVTNNLPDPFQPPLFQALLLPSEDEFPADLPPGVRTLEVSPNPPAPGQALGIRGTLSNPATKLLADIDGLAFVTKIMDDRFAGLAGTGAFFPAGQPEVSIRLDEQPVWIQPWQFAEKEWDYQSLTLTGAAAQIDQQARDEERQRLREIWTTTSPDILWDAPFRLPIDDYLELSATYGGRRSYNGGPFLTYHEGVDFSAYAGTPVFAPAAGTIVVAEPLYVRGGAVIIDHGLGLYSGYYHLSEINVQSGQTVQPGDRLGGVGTTGLSTGNHLHWDLLINGTWVDAMAWLEQDMACWVRTGLNLPCEAIIPDS